MSLLARKKKLLMQSMGQPAPVLRSASESMVGSQASNTINKPSGVASGDLLIAICFKIANAQTITLPSGWAQEASLTPGSGANTYIVATKIAGGSEPSSYTFTWGGTNAQNSVIILAFSVGSGINLIGALGFSNSGAPPTIIAPSITPTLPGYLLAAFGDSQPSTVSSPPTGMAHIITTSGSLPARLTAYGLDPSPAGATGGKSLTWSIGGHRGGFQLQVV